MQNVSETTRKPVRLPLTDWQARHIASRAIDDHVLARRALNALLSEVLVRLEEMREVANAK